MCSERMEQIVSTIPKSNGSAWSKVDHPNSLARDFEMLISDIRHATAAGVQLIVVE